MSLYANVTPIFLDTVIGLLVPLFLTTAGGNEDAAREAAESMLASYDVETEEEIRLAAEITNFGFGALEALSKSMDPNLPLNAVLRLRGSANALHRSGHQCQRALDKLRKERNRPKAEAATVEQPAAAVDVPPIPAQPISTQPQPQIILSRQQRRALQRAVDKAERRRAEQARRDAMRAARSTPSFPVSSIAMPAAPALTVATMAAASDPAGLDHARTA